MEVLLSALAWVTQLARKAHRDPLGDSPAMAAARDDSTRRRRRRAGAPVDVPIESTEQAGWAAPTGPEVPAPIVLQQTKGWAARILVIVIVLALVGVIGAGIRAALENAGTSVGPEALHVGECFRSMDKPDAYGNRARTVSCGSSHDGEVFFAVDLTARTEVPDPWPGRDLGVSTDESRRAFAAFVGQAQGASALRVGAYYPTEADWRRGERHVVFFVSAPDGGKHAGSYRLSHR